jgi:hypothetical protein
MYWKKWFLFCGEEYQTCNLEGKIIRGTTKNKLKEKNKKKR